MEKVGVNTNIVGFVWNIGFTVYFAVLVADPLAFGGVLYDVVAFPIVEPLALTLQGIIIYMLAIPIYIYTGLQLMNKSGYSTGIKTDPKAIMPFAIIGLIFAAAFIYVGAMISIVIFLMISLISILLLSPFMIVYVIIAVVIRSVSFIKENHISRAILFSQVLFGFVIIIMAGVATAPVKEMDSPTWSELCGVRGVEQYKCIIDKKGATPPIQVAAMMLAYFSMMTLTDAALIFIKPKAVRFLEGTVAQLPSYR